MQRYYHDLDKQQKAAFDDALKSQLREAQEVRQHAKTMTNVEKQLNAKELQVAGSLLLIIL